MFLYIPVRAWVRDRQQVIEAGSYRASKRSAQHNVQSKQVCVSAVALHRMYQIDAWIPLQCVAVCSEVKGSGMNQCEVLYKKNETDK